MILTDRVNELINTPTDISILPHFNCLKFLFIYFCFSNSFHFSALRFLKVAGYEEQLMFSEIKSFVYPGDQIML